jgi:hypothetical protein
MGFRSSHQTRISDHRGVLLPPTLGAGPLLLPAFGGEGRDVWAELSTGDHDGIRGLETAGLCRVKSWPKMTKWMQD